MFYYPAKLITLMILLSLFSLVAKAEDDPRSKWNIGGIRNACGDAAFEAICEFYAKTEEGSKICRITQNTDGPGRTIRHNPGFITILTEAYIPGPEAPKNQLDLLHRAHIAPDGSNTYVSLMVSVEVSRTWLPYKLWVCKVTNVEWLKE